MKEIIFQKTDNLPVLYRKDIFFETIYPMLLSCVDDNNNTYLASLCLVDSDQNKWVVTKVSEKTIQDMLSDKITMHDAFLVERNPIYLVTMMKVCNWFSEDITNNNRLLEEYLPTQKYYFLTD